MNLITRNNNGFNINDKVDENDIKNINKRFSNVISAKPCPITIADKGENAGKEVINPHVTRFHHANGIITDLFHIKPIYYLHQNGGWRPMEEVTYGFGNTWIDLKEDWDEKMDIRYLKWLMDRIEVLKGILTITIPIEELVTVKKQKFPIREGKEIFFSEGGPFYPAAGANSPVDGDLGQEGMNAIWNSVARGAGNTSRDTVSPMVLSAIVASLDDPNWEAVHRAIILFDISSIAGTISAATLSLYGTSATDVGNWDYGVNIYESNPASNNALVDADFGNFTGTTPFSTTILVDNWTSSAYNAFAINGDGITFLQTAIDGDGIVKLGTKDPVYDVANSPPTWVNQAGGYLWASSADHADTTQDPKLVVTYTPAPITYTVTFTGDASLLEVTSATFTGDANLKSLESATFTGDANLVREDVINTFTGDASLSEVMSATFTGDASLASVESATFTGDALLQTLVITTFTGDTFLQTLVTVTFTGDANLKSVESTSFTGDANLESEESNIFTGNANLIKEVSATFAGDSSLLIEDISATFTSDAALRYVVAGSFTGDSNLVGEISTSFSGDANLFKIVATTFAGDANLIADKLSWPWQRKIWFDGTYHWRSSYDPTIPAIKFEYSTDCITWNENTNARITDTGVSADFAVNGEAGDVYIAYSDGEDVYGRKSVSYPSMNFTWSTAVLVYDGSTDGGNYTFANISWDGNQTRINVMGTLQLTGGGNYSLNVRRATSANSIPTTSGVNKILVAGQASIVCGAIQPVNDEGNGHLITVWKKGTAIESDYRAGNNNATGWDGAISIATGKDGLKFGFGIIHDDTNLKSAVIYIKSDGTPCHKERTSGTGNAWGGEDVLDDDTEVRFPVIGEHADGDFHLLWLDSTSTIRERSNNHNTSTWDPILANDPADRGTVEGIYWMNSSDHTPQNIVIYQKPDGTLGCLIVDTDVTPTKPTAIETDGNTNPVGIDTLTPNFTALFHDTDASDVGIAYHLQVRKENDSFADVFQLTNIEDITTSGVVYGGSGVISLYGLDDTNPLGGAFDGSTFTDGSTFSQDRTIKIVYNDITCNAGSTLTITYDTGQTLVVYLPAITEQDFLYVTTDGTTWNNLSLDELAYANPSTQWAGTETYFVSQPADGERCENITYAGNVLSLDGNKYFVRIRMEDDTHSMSPWSDESASFKMATMDTFTGDANLVIEDITNTFSGDASLLSVEINTFTSDSNLVGEVVVTFSGDSNLLLEDIDATFTGDASLLSVESASFTSDASLKSVEINTFTGDTSLSMNVIETFSGDASLLQTLSTSFTSDASLLEVISTSFTGDANLEIEDITNTFTGDAEFAVIYSSSFTGDSSLLKIGTETFSGDSLLQAIGYNGFAGIITLDNNEQTYGYGLSENMEFPLSF